MSLVLLDVILGCGIVGCDSSGRSRNGKVSRLAACLARLGQAGQARAAGLPATATLAMGAAASWSCEVARGLTAAEAFAGPPRIPRGPPPPRAVPSAAAGAAADDLAWPSGETRPSRQDLRELLRNERLMEANGERLIRHPELVSDQKDYLVALGTLNSMQRWDEAIRLLQALEGRGTSVGAIIIISSSYYYQ